MKTNRVVIEYLYLDLQSCDRCIGTDAVLEEVLSELAPTLRLAGYDIDYQKIKMETTDIATRYQFLSSPTIRVNGQDICASVTENSCGCCSDISGDDVDCRTFVYDNNSYEIPPKEMLAKRILQAIFTPEHAPKINLYTIPDNLRRFFTGKTKNSICNCSSGCCDIKE